jgi:hypothetical protein
MTVPPPGTMPAAPVAAVIDGVDVDAVAAAVQGCPGVSGLDGGRFGEVASYLPGRRVAGVVVSGGRVTVQVRSRWAVPAADLLSQITAVLAPITGRRVDVVIADIDDPPAPEGSPPPELKAAARAAGLPGLAASRPS